MANSNLMLAVLYQLIMFCRYIISPLITDGGVSTDRMLLGHCFDMSQEMKMVAVYPSSLTGELRWLRNTISWSPTSYGPDDETVPPISTVLSSVFLRSLATCRRSACRVNCPSNRLSALLLVTHLVLTMCAPRSLRATTYTLLVVSLYEC
jgi:hypothetical protein